MCSKSSRLRGLFLSNTRWKHPSEEVDEQAPGGGGHVTAWEILVDYLINGPLDWESDPNLKVKSLRKSETFLLVILLVGQCFSEP